MVEQLALLLPCKLHRHWRNLAHTLQSPDGQVTA